MDWLLLATGFMGGLTSVFGLRWVQHRFFTPPSIAAYHSPKGGCTDAILKELRHARREILFQAYSFTSKDIAQALIEAKMRGVRVEVVLDKSNERESDSQLGHLLQQGLAPLLDTHHAIAHNNVIVIDRKTLLTGGFSFTHAAEHDNAENLVIIKGHPDLAADYCQTFAGHKAHSQPAVKQAPAVVKKAA